MKKITLLLLALLVSTYGFAQINISFEASEGYTLGDIHGQNGWTVTTTQAGVPVDNQVVSDDMASDGVNSLKIQVDPNFGTQGHPVIGGFYNFSPQLNYHGASYTADIYMVSSATRYRFGPINAAAGAYTNLIQFDADGKVRVIRDGDYFDTGATWAVNTWYEVKIETSNSDAMFYIDGVQVYSGPALSVNNVDRLGFVHDNSGGVGYMDNVVIVDGELSTVNPSLEQVSVYPNPASNVINVKVPSNVQINGASLYDVLGKNTGVKISNGQINIAHLSRGVYMLSLETSAGSLVKKIIKQ